MEKMEIRFERRKDLGNSDVQRYLDEIRNTKPLDSEEEGRLGRQIQLGDVNARNKLVEANLRFVVSIALEYKNSSIPLGDLIEAGNIGLITAAERFDGSRGFKFISYAVHWVRQAILMTFIEEKRVVKLPVNRIDHLRDIYKIMEQKLGQNEWAPTPEEIALEMNLSAGYVRDTLVAGQTECSIDSDIGCDDDGRTFHEVLLDSQQASPEESHRLMALKLGLNRALGTLEEREAEIVRLCFGLEDDNHLTLQEIGDRFGVTRERVRQIREKALRKLRHPTRAEPLRDKSKKYNELFLSAARG